MSDSQQKPNRQPQFVSGQLGRRMISMAALTERIEAAFVEEYGEESEALREADTPTKRLKLLLGTVDYVLAVESVQVSPDEKADLLSRAYSNLFSYGPLDTLFMDERVTTISLEGYERAAVRYGSGDLTPLGTLFQDAEHFKRVIKRLLLDSGAEMRDDQPYMETGLMIENRPVCMNLIAPPVTTQLTADIRVHPKQPPRLEDLTASGFMTAQAAELLRALAASPHGIIVAGETESGKTTLLNALLQVLPIPTNTITVERAGELRPPPGVERLIARWPVGEQAGITFGAQIGNALAKKPACLVLDEVRADEPGSIAPLLEMPDAPRQIWSFRGAIFAKRLQSALSMLARRADFGQGEELVRSLYQRLPFVVSVIRTNGQLRLWSVSEWQFKDSPDYPTYTPLLQTEQGELKRMDQRPARPLDLPTSFWD
jgi:Flp pilus assembly CpaF family ATPase